MATVSITDLTNAKLDTDHIADIATSLALTAVDRLGTTKKTLQGAINSISAITDRGPWTTATAYAVKDVVLDTGVYYICITAHTSGATFAGDSAKWRVYQGDLGTYHSVDVVNDIRSNDFSNRKMIRIATERRNPVYYLDSTDTTSVDDDSLVIVDAAGNRWKKIVPEGVFGNSQQAYYAIGSALRRDTGISPDWFVISDSAHLPLNTTGVSLASTELRVAYNGAKIGTLIAAPDETFARAGITTGASVSASYGDISAGCPCDFTIDLDSANALSFDSRFFDAVRFSVSVSSTGLITLIHPQRQIKQMPTVRHTANSSTAEMLTPHYIQTPTDGQTTFYLVGEAEGLISYSGSAWGISTSAWSTSDLTFSYNAGTGELTVTHPTVVGSPGISIAAWDSGGDVAITVKSVSATGFIAKFRKISDGTIPSLTSALGFYFSRGRTAIRKTPTGKLHIDVGHVQLNMSHVDSATGNIWVFGAMEQA